MLSEEKYSIKFLDWDTNFFGIKSAKIYLYDEIDFMLLSNIHEEIVAIWRSILEIILFD